MTRAGVISLSEERKDVLFISFFFYIVLKLTKHIHAACFIVAISASTPSLPLCLFVDQHLWSCAVSLTAAILCLLFFPIFFFFFHRQKSHWRKLTCKVDSSLCLKTSVMPLTRPPTPTPPPPTWHLPLCPRPLEPDVSLDFAHLPSEQAFRPTGIQAPSASCIRVYGGQMYCVRVCACARVRVCVVFTGIHFILFIISNFWTFSIHVSKMHDTLFQ